MEIPKALRYLAALILAAPAGSRAEVCCELPDAGTFNPIDTGRATAQEALVDLAVEKVWTATYPYDGRSSYSILRVLSKRPVDTSVFFEFVPRLDFPGSWITSYSYNATGFPDTLVDSSGIPGFVPGDTLRDVFAIWIASASHRTSLALGGLHCKYLSPVPGPFPIEAALKALDRFRDSLAAATGQAGPPSHARLGPIFIGGGGDPGLLVRAEASGDAWLIRYQTGSGDCPAGCTHHEETVYRVGPQGKVEVASQRELFVLCRPPDAIPARMHRGKAIRGQSGCYTPEGRKLRAGGGPAAAVPWLEAP